MDLAAIRTIVEAIPDPEIPVLSLGDLGIIRDLREVGSGVEIDISPTYSGCPATSFIQTEIAETLAREDIHNTKFNVVISPPWSSDWISPDGRRKLLDYGIAPPNPKGQGRPEKCPQCQSIRLARLSEFGATPCQALWRCQDCLESFSYFKCI